MVKPSSTSVLSPLHGTWMGAVLAHAILIPLWTLSPLPPCIAIALLFCGGRWTVYALMLVASFVAVRYLHLPYSPSVIRFFYDLDMCGFYRKCELRVPHPEKMGRERTLYMFHPHGILAAGFTCNGCWNKRFNALTAARDLDAPEHTGTIFLIARNLREWAPFFKVLCDLSGRLESATKANIVQLMRRGRNMAILPGGFEDATITAFGKDRTVMRARKGLIKYALQHGYALTPVYTFGESETYTTFSWLLELRLALNRWSIPGVVFFGWPVLPLFPRPQAEVITYVGSPLQLPLIAEPTVAEVDSWHEKYVRALTALFEAHKAEAKPGRVDAKLEIW